MVARNIIEPGILEQLSSKIINMSKKSKHRVHHIAANKKSKVSRKKHYDDERELFREDYIIKKPCKPCPKQLSMKLKEPQPNKYEEQQVKELVNLASKNQQLLTDMTIDARIAKAKQKKADNIVKTFDIWGTPVAERKSVDYTGNPIPEPHKLSARVPSVDELQGRTCGAIELPKTAVSYNPTYLSQQQVIEKLAKEYVFEDKIAAKLKAIRPSNFTPEEVHEEHVNALLQYILNRDSAQSESSKKQDEDDNTTELEASRQPSLDINAAASSLPLTDEQRRLLEENKFEAVHMTQTDRRLKRREIKEMCQELKVLDDLIKQVHISKLAASIDAGTFDIDKLADKSIVTKLDETEKKIRQPTDRKIPKEEPPVPLTEDCKGTMRLVKPVGSVFEDRWVSAQQRNLIEVGVPNNPDKQNATREWKVIVH